MVKHNGFLINYLIRGGNRAAEVAATTLMTKVVQTKTNNMPESQTRDDVQVYW